MIEIRTLGRTAVTVNGEELTGEAAWPRSLALIVYLAREPGPDRRDDVLGVLWPDRDERRARHSLNQLLYTLRRSSPELDLESVRDRIDFATDVWLDVDEFERRLKSDDPEGAVELYDGPFLSDLLIDVPEFEHWADRQRADLRRKFRSAALELVERAKVGGDLERAIHHCRRLVDVDSLDDEAQHALIELLHASGERSAALRQYDAYRERLSRELEIEPLEHTQTLVSRIRADSSGVAAGEPEPAEVAGSAAPAPSGAPAPRAEPERPAVGSEARSGPSQRVRIAVALVVGLSIGLVLGMLAGAWLGTVFR